MYHAAASIEFQTLMQMEDETLKRMLLNLRAANSPSNMQKKVEIVEVLEARGTRGLDLSYQNLHEVVFSRLDLSAVNLRGAYLSGAKFKQVDLSHADLKDCCLIKTQFEQCHFESSKLIRTNFFAAKLMDCNWVNITADAASFENATLERTRFDNVDLRFSTGLYDKNIRNSFIFGRFLLPNLRQVSS